MENSIKSLMKLSVLAIISLLIIMFAGFGADAVEKNVDFGTLVTGATTEYRQIRIEADDDVLYWNFTVPKAGKVVFQAQFFRPNSRIYIEDLANHNCYLSTSISAGSSTEPYVYQTGLWLKEGSYRFRVTDNLSSGFAGSEKIFLKLTYSAAAVNEREHTGGVHNDTKDNAELLSIGTQKTGVLLKIDDRADTYKFSVGTSGRFNINVLGYTKVLGCTIYDSGWNTKGSFEINGTETTPQSKNLELNLSSGTYYIQILGDLSGKTHAYGRYDLSVNRMSDIGSCTVTVASTTYTGSAVKPSVAVKDGTTLLKNDTDYTLTFENNVNAGSEAKVTITGKGKYYGTKTVKFTIRKKSIASFTATLSTNAYVYNGEAKKPGVIVKDASGKTFYAYDKIYKNNINAGTASVVITGTGNYTGTITKTFTISRIRIAVPAVTKTFSYNSNYTRTPIKSGTGYTRSGTYTAKAPGVYTVKVTPTSNYAWSDGTYSTKSFTWSIKPSATKITSWGNTNSGIKIIWSKVYGADGYIIYRDGVKIKTITDGSTLNFTDADTKTVVSGKKYLYKVYAYADKTTCKSSASPEVTTMRVKRPSSITLTAGKACIKLDISAVKNVEYEIWRSETGASGSYKYVHTTSKTTVTNQKLTSGKTYYYKVRSVKTMTVNGNEKKIYSPFTAAKYAKVL
ncbi:MAG: hypothetical protein Q4C42_08180 [Clostridia bacterium]|nr:hypothetical protein [Clostridia bacterium]